MAWKFGIEVKKEANETKKECEINSHAFCSKYDDNFKGVEVLNNNHIICLVQFILGWWNSLSLVYIVFGPLILLHVKWLIVIEGLLNKLNSKLVIQVLQYGQYISRLVHIPMITFQFGILMGFVPIPKLHFM
jgi:hypothetical protein